MNLKLAPVVLCLLLAILGYSQAVTVWTRSYDNSRTNAQLEETQLNTNNVNSRQFGKLFARKVVGHVYAQVLYVPNLRMKNGATHNVMFVATMANNLYAFDADDPNKGDPLWMTNFGTTVPIDEQEHWFEHSEHCAVYTDILIEVGIISTPVIDTATNLMYVMATNKDSDSPYTVHHRLYAVDITSGEVRLGPVVVEGSVPGTGIDAVNGVVTFNSKKQSQRHALTLVNGIVYMGFGSYCTAPPYHGWVFGYRATNLQRVFYFCTTPNSEQGSMWHSGQGMVSDGTYLYGVTTNGVFNPGTDWSNSFLKMDPTKKVASGTYANMAQNHVVDYFTPYNWRDLYVYDLDVGTCGPLLIPGTQLLMACGKQGWCYVTNTQDMGKFSETANNNWQSFQANKNYAPDPQLYPYLRMGVHTSPTTWYTPSRGRLVYIWPVADQLKALYLDPTTNRFDLSKTQYGVAGFGQTTNDPEVLFPGGALGLSANGNMAGTGIVWASHPLDGSSNREVRHGVLRAFDASDVTKEIWNTTLVPCRDQTGYYAKFHPPMIADGKVFLGSFSQPPSREASVSVYGLLPSSRLNEEWMYDPCCVVDSCEASCCMGMCYDPNIFTCTKGILCPKGSLSCGGACYDPNIFGCANGVLYPVGNPPPPGPSPSPEPVTSSPSPQESNAQSSRPQVSASVSSSTDGRVDDSLEESHQESANGTKFNAMSVLITLAVIAIVYFAVTHQRN